MLTFRQLEDAGAAVEELFSKTAQEIVDDMARRIATMGRVSDATQWQASRLEAIGAEQEFITKRLRIALEIAEYELIQMFDEASTRALAFDDKIYKAAGYKPIPLADNPWMQQIVRAGLTKTLGEYSNLTQTTAATATRQFERVLDVAYQKLISGAFSYQDVIRDGVRTLSSKGIESIRYPTGHVDYMDVAFRRATLTGLNQTAGELQIERMREMDTDLVETTAHAGARTYPTAGPENHAWWQGRWYSLSGADKKYPSFYACTGYGSGVGLCGWNCRHSFFPVIPGLSERAYDYNTLRDYNNRKVTYDGKTMDLYDATQQQRYIERQVRRWKREASALDVAGLNDAQAKGKVREWQARQRDFIKQTGLTRDYFRERAGSQLTAGGQF